MIEQLDKAIEKIEKLKKGDEYTDFGGIECIDCVNAFLLFWGSKGYGKEVFAKDSGRVTIRILEDKMLSLLEQALSKGTGEIEIITDIEDRLGSPGWPEYLWYEDNVKQYEGKAIVSLVFENEKPVFSYKLPEHHLHKWGGW